MAGLLGQFAGAVGGSTIGTAVVRLELASAAYDAELAKAEAKTKAATNSMGSSASQSSAAVSKSSAIMTAAFAVAGLAAVKFAAMSVKAASDLNEQMNRTQVVFAGSTAAVVDFASKSAASLGISETAALQAASSFGAMFQAAQLSEAESAKMSLTLVQLAADMASFNNTDPSEMLKAIQSGLAGMSRPLRQYGVFLSDATITQNAYDTGIAKTGATLTDAQKIQARYNVILEQTTKQQGDFQRTLGDSLPNQLRVLTASFEDLQASVGSALLPSMLDLTKAAVQLVNDIGPGMAAVFGAIGDAASTTATQISDIIAPVQWLISNLPGLKQASADDGSPSFFSRAYKSASAFANSISPQNMIVPFGRFKSAWDAWNSDTGPTADSSLGGLATTTGLLSGTVARAGDVTDTFSASLDRATAAMKAQKDAANQLVGGLLGLAAQAKQVATDQKLVNQMQEQGKTSGAKYQAAVAALLGDQNSLNTSIRDYAQKLKDSGLSSEEAVAKVERLGKSLGISKQDVLDILDPLGKYKGLLDSIPPKVSTEITADTAAAMHSIGDLLALMASAGIKTSPGAVQLAAHGFKHGGGPVVGASGRDVPIMAQAGEYVINAETARKLGSGFLSTLNKMHHGGMVRGLGEMFPEGNKGPVFFFVKKDFPSYDDQRALFPTSKRFASQYHDNEGELGSLIAGSSLQGLKATSDRMHRWLDQHGLGIPGFKDDLLWNSLNVVEDAIKHGGAASSTDPKLSGFLASFFGKQAQAAAGSGSGPGGGGGGDGGGGGGGGGGSAAKPTSPSASAPIVIHVHGDVNDQRIFQDKVVTAIQRARLGR